MLYIRTGLPGNGKTLNTIKEVDIKAKSEGRTVYYFNVADLKPEKLQADWFLFDDPLDWHNLPHNSIIVIDEAQGWFGVRDPRKDVPEHISAFETLRHRGHEVHLITQDPRFIDVHARRLCNKHIHYWRIFGSSKVSRYETERVVNDVEKLSSFKQSSRTVITLDKKYFGVYTSTKAEHHFRFNPSKKAVMAVLVILFAVVGSFLVYNRISERWEAESSRAEADTPEQSTGSGSLVGSVVSGAASMVSGSTKAESRPVSKAEYLAERTPRVDNLPASAPIYDALTEPKSFPRLYCMSSTDPATYAREAHRMASAVVNGEPTVCQCYTQQGTRFETDFRFCKTVVDYGYFDATLPDRRPMEQQRQTALTEAQPL